MLDFEVHRCTRRCAATERELQPSESFYSVLVQEGAQIIRRDYCLGAWQGAPDNAIGFWKSEMPDPAAHKLHWAPNDVMRHYFRQLIEQDTERDTAYVLALLMVRRRLMRLEETERVDAEEVLVLVCPQSDEQFRVPVVEPTANRIQEIQECLANLLFAQAEKPTSGR